MSVSLKAGSIRRIGPVGLLGLIALSATGCVSSEYAAIDVKAGRYHGYSDALNVDGSHSVRVMLPQGRDNAENARAYFHRRAEEICGGPPLRKTIHTAVRPGIAYDMFGNTVSGNYLLEGLVYCAAPAQTEAPAAEPAPPVA
ncbi:MAG: hypothetical protein REJ23_00830 [Brevundimonas sp.]|nr:hypothetical protein [Brevundimonas sp.]